MDGLFTRFCHFEWFGHLMAIIVDHEFDSESVQQDIGNNANENTSNICREMQNESAMREISMFVKFYRCMCLQCVCMQRYI